MVSATQLLATRRHRICEDLAAEQW